MKTTIYWAGDATAGELPLAAYAFDAHGVLTDIALVRENQATLDVAERGARVLIAPEGRIGKRKPTIDELQKQKAYEPALRIGRGVERVEIAPIPPELIHLWPLPFCRIRGRVVKHLHFFGFDITLPVCRARVHICEVDPLFIVLAQVPDPVIHRLRDDLLAELSQIRVPIPKPDPAPGPLVPTGSLDHNVAAGPVDPVPWRGAAISGAFAKSARVRAGDAVALNPQPLPPKERAMTQLQTLSQSTAINLPAADLVRLSSHSALTVRDALLENLALLHPILCALPWFWPWLRCDEVRVVETDGRWTVCHAPSMKYSTQK